MRFKRFNRLLAQAIGLCLAAVTAAAPARAAGAFPEAPDSPDPYALEAPAPGTALLAGARTGEVVDSGTCGAEEEGKNLTWTVTEDNSGQYTLTISGNGTMADYSWFDPAPWSGCTANICYLVVNSGVTSVGDYAFYNCAKLSSVTLPEGFGSIGAYAFSSCALAGELKIPEGVTEIGDRAFQRNGLGLTGVILPASLEAIGDSAFSGCYNLASVKFPDSASLTSIGDNAFGGCTALAGELVVPAGVKTIGQSAFQGCANLASVALPDSLETIGDKAFYKCPAIKSFTVAVDNKFYSHESGLLLNKDKTELIACPVQPAGGALEVPNGVVTIRDGVFYDCSSLTSVAFPDSLETIGKNAFLGCASLASVALPDSLTSIGDYAFGGCALTSVSIPGSVTTIGSGAFQNCAALAGLTVSQGVVTIGDYAFQGCKKLTSLKLPDSLKNIEQSAFEGCASLASVALPDSLETIGYSAFQGCSALTELAIPEGVTEIGSYAFYDCSAIKSFTVASGNPVYSFHDGLLLNKNKTELLACLIQPQDGALIVPETVETIAQSAFQGCTSLTSVGLPEGVTGVGNYAFYGCSGLESVSLPASLTSIGTGAFTDCASLRTVVYNGTAEKLEELCGGDPTAAGFAGNQTFSYPVAVKNGGAGASAGGNYASGASVTLNAGTKTGYTFSGWTVTGVILTADQLQAETLTFTMPGGPVTASANWKEAGGQDPEDPAPETPALPAPSGVSQTGSTVKLTFTGGKPANGARVLAALDGTGVLSGTYDAARSEVDFQRPLEKGRKLFFLDPKTLVPLAKPAIVP